MQRISIHLATIAALICSQILRAQTTGAVAGAGFIAPVPIAVAPGGLMTLFVQGIGTKLSSPLFAATAPLPTKLGGISVYLKQTQAPQGPFPVPILAVFPIGACRAPVFAPCGTLTGINVQIPFELVPNPSTPDPALSTTNYAQAIISEDGGGQVTVEVAPHTDRIHVLRIGDTLNRPAAASPDTPISALAPVITHPDGTLVTLAKPADPGETLIMYAVGLGPVLPLTHSGEATPAAPPVALVRISFDFRPDASPTRPSQFSSAPAFSGLTPGFVGLYQINFVVPKAPPGYRVGCNTDLGNTNLTVSIGRLASFDGAGICVRIPGQ